MHDLFAFFAFLPRQGLRLRAGIVGIERNIEKKQRQTGQQVSQAFKDLDALINKVSLHTTAVYFFYE